MQIGSVQAQSAQVAQAPTTQAAIDRDGDTDGSTAASDARKAALAQQGVGRNINTTA